MKYFKVFNNEEEYTQYIASSDFIAPNVSTLRDSSKTWINQSQSVIHVTGVTLSEATVTITKGGTTTLVATVSPNDAYDKSVTWSTSDPSIATVNDGVVTAVGCGEAIITVTTTDGGYTAQCTTTVENPVTGVTLNTNILNILTGLTYQLEATVVPSDACGDKSVTWSSNNTSVATVDSTGLVTTVAAGSAIVTVTTTVGSYTATCAVEVSEPVAVTGVTLDKNMLEINTRETSQLVATVLPNNATVKSVTWSSSDDTIATVDSNGVVSGVASGSATITVTTTDGGFTAQCAVTVIHARDYSQEYFTIESLEDDNTIKFVRSKGENELSEYNGAYSIDDGSTWTEFTLPYRSAAETGAIEYDIVTIDAGEKLMFKYVSGGDFAAHVNTYTGIKTDGEFKVYGNLASLRRTDFPVYTGTSKKFTKLFYNTKVTSAKNLIFPYQTVEKDAFREMFSGCTYLVDAPTLSATTLGESCYRSMFYGCSSLTTVPSNMLPATTLANYCYQSMFNECASLTTAPDLPATTLAQNCYAYMFQKCTSLTTPPSSLPATTLYNECYREMFGDCSGLTAVPLDYLPAMSVPNDAYRSMFCRASLVVAPSLPATTVGANSYNFMFAYCPSLTTVQPSLSAATLGGSCYFQMFKGCTSLTTAPELPAINLSGCGSCYAGMFQDCTSLTTVPSNMLPATTLANNCYQNMFNGCTGLTTAPSSLPATTLTNYCYYNMFNGCKSLSASPEIHAATVGDSSCRQMFNGCTSLTTGPSTLSATTLDKGCYYSMFNGCTGLTTAPSSLPATTLTNYCYYNMFNGCKSLSASPEIHAATVGDSSCRQMFYGCRGITTAQAVLPALTLANSSYYSMYENCSKLVAAPAIMATTVDVDSCRSMFNGCTSLETAPSLLPATTLAQRCYQNMFVNCSGMTTAPELPALTLVTDCYNTMFNGCKSLTNIKCLATDISATGCTNNWVKSVASTGVFIKNSSMNSWTSGINGIPTNWTVHDDSYVTVTGVTVSPASTTVDKGSTTALTATVLPHNANDQQVTWSTSDDTIATVDSNGVVTAVGCGSANITVTTHELGYTAQCAVSVEKHVTAVDLDTYVLTINTGGTYQLTTIVTPSDACDPSVTWSTSDASIASVDTNGLVSGVSVGSATVTVTSVDTSSASCSCSVTVNEGTHVTGVTLSDNAITVTANTTYTLTATVSPFDAANKNVTWSSSDDTIATVDSNGVVSGVAKGNATITVTTVDGGFTAQCAVSVATYGYFTLRSLSDNNTFTIKNNGTGAARNFSYSLDSGNTWLSFTLNNNATQTIATINSGDTIMMKGNNTTLGRDWNAGCYFRGTQNYEVEGNISSLIRNNDTDTQITSGTFHFAQLFSGDTHLISAENLKVVSTTLYKSSFNGTFRSCTNLQKAPDLSIPTTLGQETYSSMFEACTSLSQPPSVLSATTAELSSYKRMFCMARSGSVTAQMTKSPIMIGNFGSETSVAKDYEVFKGNGSLTEVKCYWTNTSGSFGSLASWMANVSSSGTFYKRSTQTFSLNSANGIPNGWDIVNDDTTGN